MVVEGLKPSSVYIFQVKHWVKESIKTLMNKYERTSKGKILRYV